MPQENQNTFTKGMVSDLNPLLTPNSVLTDALNATILTYNGNESMLQNDMGNARIADKTLKDDLKNVDKFVRLPEVIENGKVYPFKPIGTVEHGGIIYIASQRKTADGGSEFQLGSFPGPEFSDSYTQQVTQIADSLATWGKQVPIVIVDEEGNVDFEKSKLSQNLALIDSGGEQPELKVGDPYQIKVGPEDAAEGVTWQDLISWNGSRKWYKMTFVNLHDGSDITPEVAMGTTVTNDVSQMEEYMNFPNIATTQLGVRFDLENIDGFSVGINMYPEYEQRRIPYMADPDNVEANAWEGTGDSESVSDFRLWIDYLVVEHPASVKADGFEVRVKISSNSGAEEPVERTITPAPYHLTNEIPSRSVVGGGVVTAPETVEEGKQFFVPDESGAHLITISVGSNVDYTVEYTIYPVNNALDIHPFDEQGNRRNDYLFEPYVIHDEIDLSVNPALWGTTASWERGPEYFGYKVLYDVEVDRTQEDAPDKEVIRVAWDSLSPIQARDGAYDGKILDDFFAKGGKKGFSIAASEVKYKGKFQDVYKEATAFTAKVKNSKHGDYNRADAWCANDLGRNIVTNNPSIFAYTKSQGTDSRGGFANLKFFGSTHSATIVFSPILKHLVLVNSGCNVCSIPGETMSGVDDFASGKGRQTGICCQYNTPLFIPATMGLKATASIGSTSVTSGYDPSTTNLAVCSPGNGYQPCKNTEFTTSASLSIGINSSVLDRSNAGANYFSIDDDTKWGKRGDSNQNRNPYVCEAPSVSKTISSSSDMAAEFKVRMQVPMYGYYMQEQPLHYGFPYAHKGLVVVVSWWTRDTAPISSRLGLKVSSAANNWDDDYERSIHEPGVSSDQDFDNYNTYGGVMKALHEVSTNPHTSYTEISNEVSGTIFPFAVRAIVRDGAKLYASNDAKALVDPSTVGINDPVSPNKVFGVGGRNSSDGWYIPQGALAPFPCCYPGDAFNMHDNTGLFYNANDASKNYTIIPLSASQPTFECAEAYKFNEGIDVDGTRVYLMSFYLTITRASNASDEAVHFKVQRFQDDLGVLYVQGEKVTASSSGFYDINVRAFKAHNNGSKFPEGKYRLVQIPFKPKATTVVNLKFQTSSISVAYVRNLTVYRRPDGANDGSYMSRPAIVTLGVNYTLYEYKSVLTGNKVTIKQDAKFLPLPDYEIYEATVETYNQNHEMKPVKDGVFYQAGKDGKDDGDKTTTTIGGTTLRIIEK
jgi:hypothetical protein